MSTKPETHELLAKLSEGFAEASELASAARVIVGFSGGLDSCVLLDVAVKWCRQRDIDVAAMHVHHGLQPAADDFAHHAQQVTASLDVPLIVNKVRVVDCGRGPAAAARAARYAAFEDELASGEWLLLAHHKQDQLETLLLKFLRGGGVHSRLGMPISRALGAGRLLRPLLNVAHDELVTYAGAADLAWIDDPSNASDAYARNRLRHQLLPVLAEHWPDYEQRLLSGAAMLTETARLLDELAAADLALLARDDTRLAENALMELSPARRKNLLYAWLAGLERALPSEAEYRALEQQLSRAGACKFSWAGGMLMTYRGYLRLFRGAPPPSPKPTCEWSANAPELKLPTGSLHFDTAPPTRDVTEIEAAAPQPPLLATSKAPFQVRFGQPKVGIQWRGENRSLKKIYQEFGIPAVTRPLLPLIFRGDELVAIADLCIADTARPNAGSSGIRLSWQPASDYATCPDNVGLA